LKDETQRLIHIGFRPSAGMTVESMIEHNEVIPEEPQEDVQIFEMPLVAVMV
jgi:hypothetical protein